LLDGDNLRHALVAAQVRSKARTRFGIYPWRIASWTYPVQKGRGLAFALVTVLFLPFDLLVNLITVPGSMTFVGQIAPKA
jgi:hypothetical protein